jgi:hypothetical protein
VYSYCEWLLANIKLVISMFDKACLLLCNFKILIMYDEKKLFIYAFANMYVRRV